MENKEQEKTRAFLDSSDLLRMDVTTKKPLT